MLTIGTSTLKDDEVDNASAIKGRRSLQPRAGFVLARAHVYIAFEIYLSASLRNDHETVSHRSWLVDTAGQARRLSNQSIKVHRMIVGRVF